MHWDTMILLCAADKGKEMFTARFARATEGTEKGKSFRHTGACRYPGSFSLASNLRVIQCIHAPHINSIIDHELSCS